MNRYRANPLRTMVYAAMFGALTAIGAFIVIPLQPTPITMQNLFTALAAVLLGGYAGALSQVVYVLLGCIGLPVFAGGKAGLGVLFGPTGGYLLGFIAGAYVIGKLVEIRKNPGMAWIVMSILAGYLVIYTLGTVQLLFIAHLSPLKAILLGVLPFVVPDLIKLLAAAVFALKLRSYLQPQLGEGHDPDI